LATVEKGRAKAFMSEMDMQAWRCTNSRKERGHERQRQTGIPSILQTRADPHLCLWPGQHRLPGRLTTATWLDHHLRPLRARSWSASGRRGHPLGCTGGAASSTCKVTRVRPSASCRASWTSSRALASWRMAQVRRCLKMRDAMRAERTSVAAVTHERGG
jgi:hypothetical protein